MWINSRDPFGITAACQEIIMIDPWPGWGKRRETGKLSSLVIYLLCSVFLWVILIYQCKRDLVSVGKFYDRDLVIQRTGVWLLVGFCVFVLSVLFVTVFISWHLCYIISIHVDALGFVALFADSSPRLSTVRGSAAQTADGKITVLAPGFPSSAIILFVGPLKSCCVWTWPENGFNYLFKTTEQTLFLTLYH